MISPDRSPPELTAVSPVAPTAPNSTRSGSTDVDKRIINSVISLASSSAISESEVIPRSAGGWSRTSETRRRRRVVRRRVAEHDEELHRVGAPARVEARSSDDSWRSGCTPPRSRLRPCCHGVTAASTAAQLLGEGRASASGCRLSPDGLGCLEVETAKRAPGICACTSLQSAWPAPSPARWRGAICRSCRWRSGCLPSRAARRGEKSSLIVVDGPA